MDTIDRTRSPIFCDPPIAVMKKDTHPTAERSHQICLILKYHKMITMPRYEAGNANKSISIQSLLGK